jgi:oligopeptide transport system substrate-binding protein
MWRRELGISVQLANMEFKTYIDAQMTLNYEISRSRWIGDYPDADTFLGMFVTGGGNNDTGWANPAYDALIARSRAMPAGPERKAVLGEAETLLLSELPVIPVFFGNRAVLRHTSLQGYDLAMTGNVIYKRLRLVAP